MQDVIIIVRNKICFYIIIHLLQGCLIELNKVLWRTAGTRSMPFSSTSIKYIFWREKIAPLYAFHPSFYTVGDEGYCLVQDDYYDYNFFLDHDRDHEWGHDLFIFRLVKIYPIHFRKWSRTSRSTFMIFHV